MSAPRDHDHWGNTLNVVFAVGLSILLTFLLVKPQPVYAAARYYVNANATGTNTGASWTDAYTSLQSALLQGQPGDEIWVAAGDYTPTDPSSGDREASFNIKRGVSVYGGFAGQETSLAARNVSVNVTRLSGDIGVPGDASDNSYNVVVVLGNHLIDMQTTRLDGFTITGGNADDEASGWIDGGGIKIDNASAMLANLVVTGNSAFNNGGGMVGVIANVRMNAVEFSGNTAGGRGGGIYFDNTSLVIEDALFRDNQAGEDGGGLFNTNTATISLTAVDFTANSATLNGGGMFTVASSPILTGVSFENNLSGANGGGLANWTGSTSRLIDVSFEENSAAYGGGLFLFDSQSVFLQNPILVANTATAGGGMYNRNSSFLITSGRFYQNQASDRGGGLYNNATHSYMYNTTFLANNSAQGGSAIDLEFPLKTARFVNNLVMNNSVSGSPGAAIYVHSAADIDLINSIVWNNPGGDFLHDTSHDATHCLPSADPPCNPATDIVFVLHHDIIPGGCPAGETCGAGVSGADPDFFQLPGPGADGVWATADDQPGVLRSISPAVDAGDNAALVDEWDVDGDQDMSELIPLDALGAPRFADQPNKADPPGSQAPVVDLGPYELQLPALTLTKTAFPQMGKDGDISLFSILLRNDSDLPATAISLWDPLPEQLLLEGEVTIVLPDGSSLISTDPNIALDLPILLAGEEISITFRASIHNWHKPVVNVATVTAAELSQPLLAQASFWTPLNRYIPIVLYRKSIY